MAKQKVVANVSTHSPNSDELDVEVGDASLDNSQSGQLLTDPDDEFEEVSTHSDQEPTHKGPATAPVTAKSKTKVKANGAPQQDLAEPPPVDSGSVIIPNGDDPGAGILPQKNSPQVVEEASVADDEDDFAEDELMLASDDEFADLADDAEFGEEVDGEFDADDLGVDEEFETETEEDVQDDDGAELDVTADFESIEETDDDVPLVDIDEVPDDGDEGLVFATIGKSVHAIRSNRIIASMGPSAAAKAGRSEVYLMDQFQDVVAAAVVKKGIRKGLVQAGFVLSKVKLTASKAQAKVVKAKVEAQVTARMDSLAKRDSVLEQSLAIAATGINKQFFKGVNNELKAGLETELEQAGVRGASRIVRAMFAQHGVSYAKAILTLAKRISAMPEEVRDNYVDALDMTSDGEVCSDVMDDEPDDEDEVLDVIDNVEATTVHAALSNPLRRDRTAALLKASSGQDAVFQILSGQRSLV
jgi:hypothetical protein